MTRPSAGGVSAGSSGGSDRTIAAITSTEVSPMKARRPASIS